MSLALVIQPVKGMRLILLSVKCPVLLYFSTSFEDNMCFDFSLQVLSETFLILRRNQQDIITNVKAASCEIPVICADFNDT